MGNQPAGWKIVLMALVVFCLPAAAAAADSEGVTCPKALSRGIPQRAPGTLTGSEFVRQTAAMSEVEREEVIGAELLAGDLPSFLRHLKSVTLQGQTADGNTVRVTVCVTPDYLALGSNEDFLPYPDGIADRAQGCRPLRLRAANREDRRRDLRAGEMHICRPQPLPAGAADALDRLLLATHEAQIARAAPQAWGRRSVR